MHSHLVEIFPSVERLVLELAEVDREGLGLGVFLPLDAGAVPGHGVVPHPVVVGVLTRQDAAPAGAAQRRDCKLSQEREAKAEGGKKDDERRCAAAERRMCNSFSFNMCKQR